MNAKLPVLGLCLVLMSVQWVFAQAASGSAVSVAAPAAPPTFVPPPESCAA